MNLEEELKALVKKLGEHKSGYALCGGLAVAVHGYPRATIDIDLWAKSKKDVFEIKTLAKQLGFEFVADPMSFYNEKVIIHRVSKIKDNDFLIIDIIEYEELDNNNDAIEMVQWDDIELPVLTKEALIFTKKYRNNELDQSDIKKLSNE